MAVFRFISLFYLANANFGVIFVDVIIK